MFFKAAGAAQPPSAGRDDVVVRQAIQADDVRSERSPQAGHAGRVVAVPLQEAARAPFVRERDRRVDAVRATVGERVDVEGFPDGF